MRLIACTFYEGGIWRPWPLNISPVCPLSLRHVKLNSYSYYHPVNFAINYHYIVHSLAYEVRGVVWMWDSMNGWTGKLSCKESSRLINMYLQSVEENKNALNNA